jgi:hypothetical protein
VFKKWLFECASVLPQAWLGIQPDRKRPRRRMHSKKNGNFLNTLWGISYFRFRNKSQFFYTGEE